MSDTRLSSNDVTQLTGIVAGRPQTRAADKSRALLRFFNIITDRFGTDAGKKIYDQALASKDMDAATKFIKEKVAPKATAPVPDAQSPNGKGTGTMPKDNTATAADKRTRRSFKGTITPLVTENKRRANTAGFKSLQIVLDKPGISVEDYKKAGGRSNDLAWDIDHGYVKVG